MEAFYNYMKSISYDVDYDIETGEIRALNAEVTVEDENAGE